jgi:uncharacterized cofD-like protein
MKFVKHPFLRWLLPGIKIKRYLLSIFIGILLIVYSLAIVYFRYSDSWRTKFFKEIFLIDVANKIPFGNYVILVLGFIILFFAISFVVLGLRELVASISSALVPQKSRKEIMDIVFDKRKESLKKKVVVIGGGTGVSTVLRGLRDKFVKVSAIITVADSGGSSGRLRKEMGILPPGDLRNCLVALAVDNSDVGKILSFRFREKNSCLDGHSMGNLLIAALTRMYGDFGDAVVKLGNMLGIKGEAMPFTTEDITLCAEFEDGTIIKGEAEITEHHGKIKRIFIEPETAKPYILALKRISEADLIVLGPGSLYTSIIPPLLLASLTDTLIRSRAKKIYISNIMTEPGETDHFTAFDHVRILEEIIGKNTLDYVLINNGAISPYYINKYKKSGAEPVIADLENFKKNGVKYLAGNFAVERGDVVRHSPEKIAETIMEILEESL